MNPLPLSHALVVDRFSLACLRACRMWERDVRLARDRRVVFGGEPDRATCVARDIGGALPEGAYTGGVRDDLIGIELPGVLFEADI